MTDRLHTHFDLEIEAEFFSDLLRVFREHSDSAHSDIAQTDNAYIHSLHIPV